MDVKKVKNVGWIIIIIIIFFVGAFVYNNSKEKNEIMQNEIKQEGIEDSNDNQEIAKLISEADMLELYSESSDIRVTSINKNSDNRFLVNAKYYNRVRITQSEYEEMKNNKQIIIDDITYTYETSKEYSSLGIIKSTQDTSKKYYVNGFDEEYEFQSVDNGGYDDPLTEFNREIQYEVDQNYMIRILDSNGGKDVSYISLKELDSQLIDSSFEDMQANISRGPQGIGSEIIYYKK